MFFSDFLKTVQANTVDIKKDEPAAESLLTADFEKALVAYFKAYRDCFYLSERICLGEYIENAENVFKSLTYAYKAYCELKAKLYNEGPIVIDTCAFERASEELSIEGNKLLGEGLAGQEIGKIEAGKWLLFCANN